MPLTFSTRTALTQTTTELSNTTSFSPIDPKCRQIYQNSSNGVIIKDYEGIPENLLLNIVVWLILLFLFTILRRIGDYGRFGLIKNDEERYDFVNSFIEKDVLDHYLRKYVTFFNDYFNVFIGLCCTVKPKL